MERNLRKTQVGIVTSDKMEKTVVVTIKDKVRHPLYKKIVNRTVKVKAHDEKNECGVGDRVLLKEAKYNDPTADLSESCRQHRREGTHVHSRAGRHRKKICEYR